MTPGKGSFVRAGYVFTWGIGQVGQVKSGRQPGSRSPWARGSFPGDHCVG